MVKPNGNGNGSQGNANQGSGKQNGGGNGNARKPATGFIKKALVVNHKAMVAETATKPVMVKVANLQVTARTASAQHNANIASQFILLS